MFPLRPFPVRTLRGGSGRECLVPGMSRNRRGASETRCPGDEPHTVRFHLADTGSLAAVHLFLRERFHGTGGDLCRGSILERAFQPRPSQQMASDCGDPDRGCPTLTDCGRYRRYYHEFQCRWEKDVGSMTAAFPYKKLPGTRRGLVRKAVLWEGADHIFSVTGTRFSEQYRRFYYRDIQALVIQRCARPGSIGVWLLTSFFCVVFTLFGKVSYTNGGPVWLHFSLWIVSLVLFLYLVYRSIVSLKYSCRCYIQTAVTWEELPPLYRIWNAQKALGQIRTRITEVQGAWA